MSAVLDQPAVSSRTGEDAAEILKAVLESAGIVMAQTFHQEADVKKVPQGGSGAVDPLKR
jgi:hypothetical protein